MSKSLIPNDMGNPFRPFSGQSVQNSSVGERVIQIRDVEGPVYIGESASYRILPLLPETLTPSHELACERPAELLRSRYELVEFMGRTTEERELRSWRDSPEVASIILIHGAGGQGKSRLALHFARKSRTMSWNVAEARRLVDLSLSDRLDSGPAHPGVIDSVGRLVVIDHAERWNTSDLLNLFLESNPHPLKRRWILLARSAGTWWQDLSYRIKRLGLATQSMQLGPLSDTVDSQKLFVSAFHRFAQAQDVGLRDVSIPSNLKTDPGLRTALAVNMLALVAVDSRRRGLGVTLDAIQVSMYLLQRERDNWRNLHEGGRVATDPYTMTRLTWLATMLGPLDYADTLGAIEGAAIEPAHNTDRMAKDHALVYPSANMNVYLERIQPETLAEDFLALSMPGHMIEDWTPDPWTIGASERILRKTQTEMSVVGGGGSPQRVFNPAIDRFVGAASRWPHLRNQLTALLRRHPEVALVASGAAFANIVAMESLGLEVLMKIRECLSEHRDTNRDAGIAVLMMRLSAHQLRVSPLESDRAKFYVDLSQRMYYAGRLPESINAASSAVVLYRDMANQGQECRRELSDALSLLGSNLSEIGERQKALSAADEAVAIIRTAQEETGGLVYEVAVALSRLALHLVASERISDAIDAAHESVGLFNDLHSGTRYEAQEPADLEAQTGVSTANLAVVLAAQGPSAEALTYSDQAIRTFRRLADISPGRFKPVLANVLNNSGTILTERGRFGEAEPVSDESVALLRELVTSNPLGFENRLARALTLQAWILHSTGFGEKALSINDEAVEISKRLNNCNSPASFYTLALCLSNHSVLLSQGGNSSAALQCAFDSVAIFRSLEYHTGASAQPELAQSLINLAAALDNSSEHERALDALEDALEETRQPGDGRWTRLDVIRGIALSNKSGFLAGTSANEEGLRAAEAAVDIFTRLANEYADVFDLYLASSLMNLSLCLSESELAGEEALPAAEKAVGIYRRMAASDPDQFRPKLASALFDSALLLAMNGKGPAKVAALEESVAIYSLLEERFPDKYTVKLHEGREILELYRSAPIDSFQAFIKVSMSLGQVVAALMTPNGFALTRRNSPERRQLKRLRREIGRAFAGARDMDAIACLRRVRRGASWRIEGLLLAQTLDFYAAQNDGFAQILCRVVDCLEAEGIDLGSVTSAVMRTASDFGE